MARKKKGFGARIALFMLKALLGFAGISLVMTGIYRFVPPPTTITMLTDGKGAKRDWTPLDRIDRNMVSAVIAAEDGKFCEHWGFDSEAIQKAALRNAKGGRIRGGSTISQQTAKNVFLWQGGGYFRKGLEAWFTLLIEGIWGKRRIMEMYLNVAETGIGTYGMEEGAKRYFGKGAARLSRNEAARMAAALPQPKVRSVKNPGGFTARYGRSIERRIGVVQRGGLDSCALP